MADTFRALLVTKDGDRQSVAVTSSIPFGAVTRSFFSSRRTLGICCSGVVSKQIPALAM